MENATLINYTNLGDSSTFLHFSVCYCIKPCYKIKCNVNVICKINAVSRGKHFLDSFLIVFFHLLDHVIAFWEYVINKQ